jgi:hypothetical protein
VLSRQSWRGLVQAAVAVNGDPELHALSVEIGQVMQQVRDLKAEIKRHSGNVVEVYALQTRCLRHDARHRACKWEADHACLCRRHVAQWFPEYGRERDAKL